MKPMDDDRKIRAWRLALVRTGRVPANDAELGAWEQRLWDWPDGADKERPRIDAFLRGLVWVEALSSELNAAHLTVARTTLADEGSPDDPDAQAMLAAELTRWTREHLQPAINCARKDAASSSLGIIGWETNGYGVDYNGWSNDAQSVLFPSPRPANVVVHEAPLGAVDGMLWADAALAEALDAIGGKCAKETVVELRQDARIRWEGAQLLLKLDTPKIREGEERLGELWRRWADLTPQGPLWTRTAATVLWRDVVQAKVCRLRRRPPALAFVQLELLRDTFRPGARHGVADGDRGVVLDAAGRVVAELDTDARKSNVPAADLPVIRAMLPGAVSALGSLTAQRILRFEVHEGHARVLAGEVDARALTFDGGWTELAMRAGVGDPRSGSTRDQVRDVVLAQAHLRWELGRSAGTLLSYTEPRDGEGHRRVRIILGDVLLPDAIFAEMGTSATARMARRLVPILKLPPLVGRPRDHAAQAALQLAVLAELRDRAAELVERGGVLIDAARWAVMARDVGLSPATLPRVLDAWTRDADDAPAFLARDGDRWRLAGAHAAAQAFLEEGGRREVRGRRGVKPRRKRT